MADFWINIEGKSNGQGMKLASEFYQLGAIFLLYRGRINDGQPTSLEPDPGCVAQQVEGIARRRLISFIIADQCAAAIRGNNLAFKEMLARKA